mmetsp:Transcript_21412/g.31828  ORF Transcript_21412/g.31828 Transcript_21412/m.31828 type:complete len:384 (+) Transcript_21412:160-1311(+)
MLSIWSLGLLSFVVSYGMANVKPLKCTNFMKLHMDNSLYGTREVEINSESHFVKAKGNVDSCSILMRDVSPKDEENVNSFAFDWIATGNCLVSHVRVKAVRKYDHFGPYDPPRASGTAYTKDFDAIHNIVFCFDFGSSAIPTSPPSVGIAVHSVLRDGDIPLLGEDENVEKRLDYPKDKKRGLEVNKRPVINETSSIPTNPPSITVAVHEFTDFTDCETLVENVVNGTSYTPTNPKNISIAVHELIDTTDSENLVENTYEKTKNLTMEQTLSCHGLKYYGDPHDDFYNSKTLITQKNADRLGELANHCKVSLTHLKRTSHLSMFDADTRTFGFAWKSNCRVLKIVARSQYFKTKVWANTDVEGTLVTRFRRPILWTEFCFKIE